MEEEKTLQLSAIPKTGMSVTSIDLDLTVDCNLRCIYCFKEKRAYDMPKQVAFDAIVWLIHASGQAKNLQVAFMGGEPLMRFALIKQIVPFAKRRASYHGKRIHFSATTNNTLVTDEVVAFWREWGMGFHCSIDGIPEIQDVNRPTQSGAKSSHLAEEGIKRILAYRPNVCARCTIVPETLNHLADNYRYFRSLGFTNIAMVPGNPSSWDSKANERLREELLCVLELLKDDFRKGTFIEFKGISDYVEAIAKKLERRKVACGAGRGMVLIDVDGNIWPCHRWNKSTSLSWKIGSIYDKFSEDARAKLDVIDQSKFIRSDCGTCAANVVCGGGCLAENLEENGDVYIPPESRCKQSMMFAELGKDFHDTMKSEANSVFMDRYYKSDVQQERNCLPQK